MANGQPEIIVLGGPNGCGKTTSAQHLLADMLGSKTFVNADVIARGLAGFDPDSAAIEASRIMLERLRQLAERRVSFAFETTLAGRSYAALLRQWKQEGYAVRLFYFRVASADLAVSRVAARVQSGGHNIPEGTIRQRYERSMDNFLNLYRPLADVWRWYDNSISGQPRLVEAGSDEDASCIDAAVRKAMREAVLTHARMGRAVCTLREGKVVWLSPQEVFDLFASEPAHTSRHNSDS